MNNFLSGYNFARQSDVVFSETIPDNSTYKTYVIDYFELNNNDIIFCKTDNVLKLFKILENENDIQNIKLITHESDYEINQRLFSLKPKCISNWYAQNVIYDHQNLIPIPIGLANEYCPITLKYSNLLRKGTPKKLLYINHRIQTHPEAREWVYNHFRGNDWCSIDTANLTLNEYKKQLDNHKFIICPRGNGIDTHRLWESLYHGIIPIVENSVHSKCLLNLPVIVVNSFTEITEKFLNNKFEEYSKTTFNMDKLKVSWWINSIKNGNI